MRGLLVFLGLLLPLVAGDRAALKFDGRTLRGWKVEGAPYWRVCDGLLVGSSDAAKKASHLWTKQEFGDFLFEAEYRISDGDDSGILIRGFNDQIQIGTSPSLKQDVTGSPYIVCKRGYPVRAKVAAGLLRPGDWNRLRIEARGGHYQVWLNGVAVLDYHSDTALEQGPVGLQVHPGMEMRVEFRDLHIEPLDEAGVDD